MIDRKVVQEIVKDYDLDKVKLGVVASHSALDTCDGSVEEGFKTVAFCQKGRERTYSHTSGLKGTKMGNC